VPTVDNNTNKSDEVNEATKGMENNQAAGKELL
jgi:hypothetical protein